MASQACCVLCRARCVVTACPPRRVRSHTRRRKRAAHGAAHRGNDASFAARLRGWFHPRRGSDRAGARRRRRSQPLATSTRSFAKMLLRCRSTVRSLRTQRSGDRLVRRSAGDEEQHLQLARREPVGSARTRGAGTSASHAGDVRRRRRAAAKTSRAASSSRRAVSSSPSARHASPTSARTRAASNGTSELLPQRGTAWRSDASAAQRIAVAERDRARGRARAPRPACRLPKRGADLLELVGWRCALRRRRPPRA